MIVMHASSDIAEQEKIYTLKSSQVYFFQTYTKKSSYQFSEHPHTTI